MFLNDFQSEKDIIFQHPQIVFLQIKLIAKVCA